MGEWIKEHQKKLSLSLGVLLIIGAVASLFWSNLDSGVTDEERMAAASVARMEARMSGQSSGAQQQAPEKPMFSSDYRETQKEQLRYAVVIALIFGIGFVGYGLLKKEEKS
ncbi:MAG: hypothetical protein U9Q62_07345 [Campylobacterota bacterium]|nr:hypothetical protein [Campylobacterota bacterium]